MNDNPKMSSVEMTEALISSGAVGDIMPEFLEIPDTTRIYGIRRTMLYAKMATGEIQSILLRKKGGKSGKRLVVAASVRAFLMKQLQEQKGSYVAGECNAHRRKEERLA